MKSVRPSSAVIFLSLIFYRSEASAPPLLDALQPEVDQSVT